MTVECKVTNLEALSCSDCVSHTQSHLNQLKKSVQINGLHNDPLAESGVKSSQ